MLNVHRFHDASHGASQRTFTASQVRGQQWTRSTLPNRQRLLRFRREVLTRIDELVSLKPILLVIQLLIATAGSQQFFMRSAFDNLTAFQHQDLVRAANRRKAVSDNERGAAATQGLQSPGSSLRFRCRDLTWLHPESGFSARPES